MTRMKFIAQTRHATLTPLCKESIDIYITNGERHKILNKSKTYGQRRFMRYNFRKLYDNDDINALQMLRFPTTHKFERMSTMGFFFYEELPEKYRRFKKEKKKLRQILFKEEEKKNKFQVFIWWVCRVVLLIERNGLSKVAAYLAMRSTFFMVLQPSFDRLYDGPPINRTSEGVLQFLEVHSSSVMADRAPFSMSLCISPFIRSHKLTAKSVTILRTVLADFGTLHPYDFISRRRSVEFVKTLNGIPSNEVIRDRTTLISSLSSLWKNSAIVFLLPMPELSVDIEIIKTKDDYRKLEVNEWKCSERKKKNAMQQTEFIATWFMKHVTIVK
ncbi:hypothetical protein Bhyg_12917 [Pseudolycoriella hygida]|uniref:Uncharacterized protein n=1 Tax=Pseudolycoriella hygida TaxID=35572 RepID=A0A9Q0S1N2_9DIPT|nr:hypothetical protein Bhyg_12917 [Pseudolycoriella hygida]